MGAAVSWRRAGSPFGVRAGWIGERETLLGSVAEGAFGTLTGDTAFVGVDASTDLGRWRIGANAELGKVAPATRGGLLTRVSSLATSAFALYATRALADSGALRFSVSQPLRVESGRASFRVSTGRNQARRGVVQHGTGGLGAQRPAGGYRRTVAPRAGQGRASPGRGLQPPAGTS